MPGRKLVIDASVARACGGESATFPTSKICRDFLMSVLTICHHAAFNAVLVAEWDKHQSTFARRWRVQMVAKGKLTMTPVVADERLRQAIDDAVATEARRVAISKDMHLVEAALDTDHIVVSLDRTVQEYLSEIAGAVPRLRRVAWVDPSADSDGSTLWLRQGAKALKSRCLGHGRGEGREHAARLSTR